MIKKVDIFKLKVNKAKSTIGGHLWFAYFSIVIMACKLGAFYNWSGAGRWEFFSFLNDEKFYF